MPHPKKGMPAQERSSAARKSAYEIAMLTGLTTPALLLLSLPALAAVACAALPLLSRAVCPLPNLPAKKRGAPGA